MLRWRALIVPAIAAVLGYLFLDVVFWETAKQGLLVSLSVIGAAVLVRLARGMPFNNLDMFEVSEIRDLAKATRQVMRSLRVLIVIAFAAMFGLVIFNPLADFIAGLSLTALLSRVVSTETLSGVLAFLITYVFVRIVDVVRGDYDLVELQSSFMVRMVERREAKRFADAHGEEAIAKLKPPEGYGKVVQ